MYHIIVNSLNIKGKNAKKLDTVLSVFERAGKQYAVYETEYRGHARKIASALSKREKDLHLVAMGGDGTLHEVLNGIRNPSACHLGFIPLGSSTDFAAAAGIPSDDVKYAAEIIVFKAPSAVDYIELSNGLRAINAVGYGMDVEVLHDAYSGKRAGRGKYRSAFIKAWLKNNSYPFKVICDGKETEHDGLMVCLSNGTQIGGGLKLLPQAQLDDGYMDVLIIDHAPRRKTLLSFFRLNAGKGEGIKEVTHIKCKEATVCPAQDKFTVQAEGELYECENTRALTAKIVSGKLKFYLPKND